MKVGSGELIGVDVRIIAATNRDLNALVESGEFRLDLYYRLNTLIIHVPPLRARRGDISVLIDEFLRQEHLDQVEFTPEARAFLMDYDWKGNIRELRNCVEYMANISDGRIGTEHLPDYILEGPAPRPIPVPGPSADTAGPDRALEAQVLGLLLRRPLGRRALLQALEQEGADVTEYRLRSVLAWLCQEGYITFGRGRAGCSVTRAGEEYLATLPDRAT